MANFFSDNQDLMFQYQHGLLWDELVATSELNYTLPGGPKNLSEARAFYDEVMQLVGDLAANEVAPHSLELDAEGATLKNGEVVLPKALNEIMKKMAEAGILGMCVPREYGGSNCPVGLSFVANEILARADVSVMTHIGFHGGIALAMLAYAAHEGSLEASPGSLFGKTRWNEAIAEIVAGKAWGCMVLTEPDCGSDLAAIRTKATWRDGKWYLTGNKIFITSGHAQYQFVLARSEPQREAQSETQSETQREPKSGALDGLKGLSLFMVPRRLERDGQWVDNVRIDKVEHKLGHHASATCSLIYEDSEGELIGKRGEGFELMLMLMNGARIAVGFEAIGLAQACYEMARNYADLRHSMGKALSEHELVAEMLMETELDIRGLRALAFAALNYQELAQKYDLILRYAPPKDEGELARIKGRLLKLRRRSRELTPLLKYWGGEKVVEIARRNLQIHGGSGYMVEVGAEKLMRDALAVPVYEGTSQIQALMALKDQLMGVLRDPTRFARKMSAASIKVTTAKNLSERQLNLARLEVYRSLTHLLGRIAGKKLRYELGHALRSLPANRWPNYLLEDFMREWDMKVDFSYGLLHAERLTKMLCEVEISHVLARQASEFPERRALAERYIQRMLPRVRAWSEEIRSGDRSVFEWIAERAKPVTDEQSKPSSKHTEAA